MQGRIDSFDPREGGMYRMALTYEQPVHSVAGKTSQHSDVVRGRFLKLVADERIVQLVEFESEDPAFAGPPPPAPPQRWRHTGCSRNALRRSACELPACGGTLDATAAGGHAGTRGGPV
jgi:hypothetical protein